MESQRLKQRFSHVERHFTACILPKPNFFRKPYLTPKSPLPDLRCRRGDFQITVLRGVVWGLGVCGTGKPRSLHRITTVAANLLAPPLPRSELGEGAGGVR
jgi:hypothetical protein